MANDTEFGLAYLFSRDHAAYGGYYAWKAVPNCPRAQDDQRLLGLKQAWLETGGEYGYRKRTLDMRDLGESCGKHRVARLLKQEGLLTDRLPRRPGARVGKPAVVAPNRLQRQSTVAAPISPG